MLYTVQGCRQAVLSRMVSSARRWNNDKFRHNTNKFWRHSVNVFDIFHKFGKIFKIATILHTAEFQKFRQNSRDVSRRVRAGVRHAPRVSKVVGKSISWQNRKKWWQYVFFSFLRVRSLCTVFYFLWVSKCTVSPPLPDWHGFETSLLNSRRIFKCSPSKIREDSVLQPTGSYFWVGKCGFNAEFKAAQSMEDW